MFFNYFVFKRVNTPGRFIVEILKVFDFAVFVDFVTIVLAIYAVLQVIVRMTPTKKDDQILSGIGRFLNFIFLKSNISNSKIDFLKKHIIDVVLNDVFEESDDFKTALEAKVCFKRDLLRIANRIKKKGS